MTSQWRKLRKQQEEMAQKGTLAPPKVKPVSTDIKVEPVRYRTVRLRYNASCSCGGSKTYYMITRKVPVDSHLRDGDVVDSRGRNDNYAKDHQGHLIEWPL